MIVDPGLIALKILLTMAVVLTAAFTAERAGPFFGALIACLPVSAGPSYVLLSLQETPAFIAASALGSAAASAAGAVFLCAYALLAPRHGVLASWVPALVLWLASVALIRLLPSTVVIAALVNAAAYGSAIWLAGRIDLGLPARRSERRWYEFPLTALMVGLLVVTVVDLSPQLGASLTGIAALFPVTFSSLILALHPRLGGRVAAATMAGALRVMPGFSLGCLVLHVAAVPLGSAFGMLVALGVMLGWSGTLVLWRMRQG
jgi:hypothetical protein